MLETDSTFKNILVTPDEYPAGWATSLTRWLDQLLLFGYFWGSCIRAHGYGWSRLLPPG
jgi:hypothetical protein